MNYDNMTREELIDELKKIRIMVEHLAITYNEHQDLLAEIDAEYHERVHGNVKKSTSTSTSTSRSGIPRYTCECGTEINITRKNRHEASARHIRLVANIKE
jgi:hypothetical protein